MPWGMPVGVWKACINMSPISCALHTEDCGCDSMINRDTMSQVESVHILLETGSKRGLHQDESRRLWGKIRAEQSDLV